ncbi:MAG: efflux RND transporter periplasmic adaptor subunit [Patescibacteria group bacterium]
MKYSKIIFFIVLVLILGLGAVGYGIRSKAAQEDSQSTPQAAEEVKATEPVLRVTVMEVSRDKTAYVNLLGIVKSESLVKVFPATSGQITDVHAKEGARVNKGDVLFTLGGINGSKPVLAYQLEIARANYESAQRAYELVEQGNDVSYETAWLQLQSARKKLGIDNNDISDAVRMAEKGVDGIETKNEASLLQAETQLVLAKKNYEMAKLQQDMLVVKAPTSGLLAEVAVSSGDMVSPQLMLTQIVNSNNFELKVAVDADTANKIRQGTDAEVQIAGAFTKTKVISVSPIADAASKMVNVTLELPNNFFRVNQTLNSRIALAAGNGIGAYFVPLDAVIIGTEEKYVFVYENGKAKKVNVRVGVIENDQAEVLEGLSEFDKIIVDGARNLLEGQAITLQ